MTIIYVDIDTGFTIPEPDNTVKYCTFLEEDADVVEKLDEMVAFVQGSKYLAFDIETSKFDGRNINRSEGIGWSTDVLACISFSDGQTTYVVKTSHMTRSIVKPLMQALMDCPLIGHNIKFDMRFVNRDYNILPKIVYDTEIAARCANMEKGKRYRLLDVMGDYLKIALDKEMQISNWGGRIITGEQIAYSARDTYYLPQLVPLLNHKMDLDSSTHSNNTKSQYTSIFGVKNKVFHMEMEVLLIFAEMEQHGVYVDLDKIKDLLIMIRQKEITKIQRFLSAVGYSLNPRSPAKVLLAIKKAYGVQGFLDYKGEPVLVMDIQGTSQDDIKPFVGKGFEIIDALYDYRTIMNRIQRLEEFYEAASETDWRIRTSFRTWGAISGRTSNPKPNLQNIKDKEREGVNLRALFIAPKGRKLIVADFSQIQLVIIAAMTRDPVMLDVITNGFDKGIDLHKMTGAAINGITVEELNQLTPDELKNLRKKAKAVNFGLCIVKDTLIVTERGLIAIQDIVIGDVVLTHKGNWKKVTELFNRTVNSIYHITTRTGKKVSSTKEHMWRLQNPAANGKPSVQSWLESDELKAGMYMVPNLYEHNHPEIGVFSDKKYARTLGWLLSDGRYKTDANGTELIIYQSAYSNPNEHKTMCDLLLPLGFRLVPKHGHADNAFAIRNRPGADAILNEIPLDRSVYKDKTFRDIRDKMSREEKLELLAGLWDGDGSVCFAVNGTKANIHYHSVNMTLIEDIQYILESLGLITTVYAKESETVHILRVCGSRSILKFLSTIPTTKCSNHSYAPKKQFSAEEAIESVSMEQGIFDVYDFTVEDDHSFVANGLVSHNCFGMGAETLIEYALMNYEVHFTLDEAKDARKKFFDTYKHVADWHREVKNSYHNGFYRCETLFGRKSCTTNFTEATNLPVQGMEADIAKMSMIYVSLALKKAGLDKKANLVNMVHDELVFEVDDEYAEQVKDLVVCEMEGAGNRMLRGVVPVRVEANICDSWSEGK